MSTKLLNLIEENNFIHKPSAYATDNHVQSHDLFKNLNKIDKFDSSQLTYNDFFWNYIVKNIPVIITSVSNEWQCRLQWITSQSKIITKTTDSSQSPSLSSQVNFDFLKAKINNMQVPVANCSKEYYNSHQKCEMKFHDYLDYWKNSQLQIREDDINKNNILYLKDWHLKDKMPHYDFYEVPIYFASDWLNEFLIDKKEDDYRFVYMGPKGSWTSFHSDVFSSFSWSTNILGIKRWLLLPPKEELKLKDNFGNDPFSIDENILEKNHIKYYKIDQNENESIFVPSGWYHQVWNLTDTISINHNWFNGCNLFLIWKNLKNCMNKIQCEINDCRNMENFENHSQIMLKALFGINYEQFFDIMEHIVKKRIDSIKNNEDLISFRVFRYNKYHLLFDLKAIQNVLQFILNEDEIIRNNTEFISRCNYILENLKNLL